MEQIADLYQNKSITFRKAYTHQFEPYEMYGSNTMYTQTYQLYLSSESVMACHCDINEEK